LATQAGVDILKAGGSAVDAAIAVQAMLGLVEPQSSGLGGGAYLETGEPVRYFDGIASGISTGVPGAVVMLHKAHEDYGKLSWGPQMDAAIKTGSRRAWRASLRVWDVLF